MAVKLMLCLTVFGLAKTILLVEGAGRPIPTPLAQGPPGPVVDEEQWTFENQAQGSEVEAEGRPERPVDVRPPQQNFMPRRPAFVPAAAPRPVPVIIYRRPPPPPSDNEPLVVIKPQAILPEPECGSREEPGECCPTPYKCPEELQIDEDTRRCVRITESPIAVCCFKGICDD